MSEREESGWGRKRKQKREKVVGKGREISSLIVSSFVGERCMCDVHSYPICLAWLGVSISLDHG